MSQKDRQWFPLNEVPLRLFDAQHWAAFVDLCGSLEKAIESLDHPDPNILVYLRQEVIKQGGPDALEADKDERRRHAQESLIDAFREQLASGRVIANGIASQIGTRVSIDSALCRNLEFNFSANSVRHASGSFTHIQIAHVDGHTDARDELIAKCIAWLKAEGSKNKKTLVDKAREKFGKTLTTRIFNEAYKKAFSQKRGHPLGTRSKKQQ